MKINSSDEKRCFVMSKHASYALWIFFFFKESCYFLKKYLLNFWDTICNGWDWEECVHFNTGVLKKRLTQGERGTGVDVLESFALLFPWHLSEVCRLGQNGWGGRRKWQACGTPRERNPTVPEQQQHLESIRVLFCAFFGIAVF